METNMELTATNGGEMAPVGAEETTITAEDLMTEVDGFEETAETDGVGGQEESTEQDASLDQKDINKAFMLERQRIEARAEQRVSEKLSQFEPAINVGMQILNDIMRTQGVPMEVAAQMAGNNLVRAFAARENISENVARSILGAQQPLQQRQQQQQRPSPEDMAARIRNDIANMEMPDGFSFDDAVQDETFVEMLLEMPTARAIQLYNAQGMLQKAPQDIAEKLKGRQAIPQPGRPQHSTPPKIDFDSMTSEEFQSFKEKKAAAERAGKRVLF